MSTTTSVGPAEPGRFREIFEHAAVSLWEEDISRLRARLEEMARAGIDLRGHLQSHPEFAQEALGLIEVTDVNEAAVRLVGADRRESLLGPMRFPLTESARDAIGETVLAISEGRTELESESVMTRPSGESVALIGRTYIPPRGSEYDRMVVTFIDITARKEAERREKETARLLRTIIDSSPDTIFVKDRDLRMVLCNAPLAGATGRTPEETYGKTDVENGWNPELVKGNPEKGIPGWEKDDLAVLGGATIHVEEVTEVMGERRWWDTLKFPLRDAQGAVVGLVGRGRDVTEARRAQEQLATERNYLTVLLENVPDRIYFKDLESRFILASRSHAVERGLTHPSEEVGRTDADYTTPEHASRAREEEIEIIRTGRATVNLEERVTYLDGRPEAWFETTKMPLKDREGRVIGTFGISHEITRRREAEKALARERRLLDLMMDNLPDYMYLKDRESRFIRTSRSHARALGLRDPSDVVGKTDFDFYGKDTARRAFEDEQQIMRTGLPLVDFEERESYPDRPDTWVITTKMPYTDENGQVAGTFGISHDITHRKQLQERNQQLAALVDSSDDAIVGIGVDRRITVWNRGAERIYGYTAMEMLGTSTTVLIPEELEEEARMIRERIARGETVEHFETTRLRKDGKRITISLSQSAIRDETNRLIGMASVARDVTSQKVVQAQLARMQRLESLATLAGGVAHQFNNIHTIVLGYMDLVRHDRELPPRLAGFMTAAVSAVQRAGEITDRLQSMTQPAGDPAATVRLDDLARGVLPAFEARIAADQVRLILDLSSVPPASGEADRVRLACQSLVSNALDSLLGRPVRVVTVRTGSADRTTFFEVEDTGCGIPSEDLPRLFSPFFSRKGEWAPAGSPQSAVRGLGLSLAISAAMVSDYGGRIEVHSTEGAGSVFRIVLPAAGGARRGTP
ncbi:MAG TPA: PAS domain-containing protein [Spirochaetia bacterium]|nr:PAS domain-containing protein [Spirochaetia bacterium]